MAVFSNGKRGIQDGWYRAKVDKIEEVEGRYGAQLVVYFTLINGSQATRRAYLSKTVSERNQTGAFLKALGFNLNLVEDLTIDDIVGKELLVELRTTTSSSGKTYQKVANYTSIEEAEKGNKYLMEKKRLFIRKEG
jgi:hypothetical protein